MISKRLKQRVTALVELQADDSLIFKTCRKLHMEASDAEINWLIERTWERQPRYISAYRVPIK